MSIARYIREIGRGKEGARSLDETQAHDLMSQLLDGRITDLEIGAFALAMRIKGESVAELSGFLRAVHERCIPIRQRRHASGGHAAELQRRAQAAQPGAIAGLLLAREGIAVLMHGPLRDAGRVTSAEIFEALALPICSDAAQLHAAWSRGAPAFMPIDALCPPLARLLAVRRVVGLRNSGHTLAKLLAPLPHALRCGQLHAPRICRAARPVPGAHRRPRDAAARHRRRGRGRRAAQPEARPVHRRAAEAELGRDAQPGVLAHLPDLPREHDAVTTAAYIQDVLAGRKPLPAPIATQLDCLKQALAALPAPTLTPAAAA